MVQQGHKLSSAIQAEWLRKILRDFKKNDIVKLLVGLQKICFSYVLPDSVFGNESYHQLRFCLWDENRDCGTWSLLQCGFKMGIRASDLADENEALHHIRELQLQVEALQLWQRFRIDHVMALDDDIRFYTRFATCEHYMPFLWLEENVGNNKEVRITNPKTASACSSTFTHPTMVAWCTKEWLHKYSPTNTTHYPQLSCLYWYFASSL